MNPFLTRRHLLTRGTTLLGSAALASLMGPEASARTHLRPRARRVISLFQFGGPSQMELFDYKPLLTEQHGKELPDSLLKMGPLSGLSRDQKSFPIAHPLARFERRGRSGAWVSDLLPHTAQIVDDVTIVKTMTNEIVAHDPALTFLQTGTQLPGKPSMGAWLSYGLGSESSDLPAYVVLISNGRGDKDTQPLGSHLYGSGFLSSRHQGVRFRSAGDPILYLSDPPGIDRAGRRQMLDAVGRLNRLQAEASGDPEVQTRIAQYELAFRMQVSAPELLDLSDEPEETFKLYGPEARTPGTYAANCLLARRMAERGVRFVQLFHRGWDQHKDLPKALRLQCEDTDRASAALVMDLKRRGLLDDTLVVWGGEFGRTAYCQGKLAEDNYGRDHHGRCFAMWMAGGGVRRGHVHGETDDFCYTVVRDPVSVRDLHATILHCLGIDHARLTFRFQGLEQRLTGVEEQARVVTELLA